jgi:hypothetical protein
VSTPQPMSSRSTISAQLFVEFSINLFKRTIHPYNYSGERWILCDAGHGHVRSAFGPFRGSTQSCFRYLLFLTSTLSKVCFILVGAMVYSGVASIVLDWLFSNDVKAERFVENF